jgi:hypothetical protein
MAEDEEIMDLVGGEGIQEQELSSDDFTRDGFLRNPQVGETISFVVSKVIQNKTDLEAVDKKTGRNFALGVKRKNGTISRYDIYTEDGRIYTIKNWEIFFKLLGKEGALMKYAAAHNKSFKGAKISVKHILDAKEASLGSSILKKMYNYKTDEEAQAHADRITKAIKEQKLYEVNVE